MARGIKRQLRQAICRVEEEMRGHGNDKYARGLAKEGYAGGYAQALMDVTLLLDGVTPQTRNYWLQGERECHKPR